ncbi:MAG TPA: sodium:solute symporter family protein [Gemmatimonadaceae bacterium]|nr:sodium:solute symporter family protein [Gemmatimonadaceae bacterium]
MSAALVIIVAFLVIALWLGVRARRGRDMVLEQWSVGGRGFGTLFVFLLMAGEIYTTFTFLGGSGWAYGKGGPAFYILAYGALAYALSYFLLPVVWRYGKEHGLLSQADFFVSKYRSEPLGILVSLVSVVALVPYLVLQLKGLGIIVSEASYDAIPAATAVWGSTAVVVAYVIASGVRGSAWTAVLKDVMILAVALALGIYLPLHEFGGYHAMFASIERAKPGFLVLPARGMSPSWFISTVVLTALGFYMWPHTFGSAYTAKHENVFRKNAVIMPLYQLVLLFVFFTGFAAIAKVPGLKGTDVDLALLRVSRATFSPWVVGTIGAAGLLTALVPGSMILMTASTILAKNVYAKARPCASEREITLVAKWLVPVVALVAVAFTLHGGETLVVLLLMGYNFVTQLFPALVLSLPRRPLATRQGAFAGILAGTLTVAWLTVSKATMASLFPSLPSAVTDLNIGIVALVVNLAVLAVVSGVTREAGSGATTPRLREAGIGNRSVD